MWGFEVLIERNETRGYRGNMHDLHGGKSISFSSFCVNFRPILREMSPFRSHDERA